MKKSLLFAMVAAAAVACNEMIPMQDPFVVTGYSALQTRTSFGAPDSNSIPYTWSAGDYIWLGETRSQAISKDCDIAEFEFYGSMDITSDIFYNMTGIANLAKVLPTQTADGHLGNDGDFGYAVLGDDDSFCLGHKTSYIWFDTKTACTVMPALNSITVTTEGAPIAGERFFDLHSEEWADEVSEPCACVTLVFDGGFHLKTENQGVMAAMVVLPAEVAGTVLTITYRFEDGSTYVEEKRPKKDFASGATQRVTTVINESDLIRPSGYELRILSFEDEDARFAPYELDYAGAQISTWTDLVDDPQYGGPLTYGDMFSTMYTWWDEENTDLMHLFPSTYETYCYWSGGHAISNYWGEGYADHDRDRHIVRYYGEGYVDQWAGIDAMLGWFNVQLMVPVPPHSGDNFAVHFGYVDFFSMLENLPEISFADEQARIIDHMYVTNTNYVLNQLMYGVGSEAGNSFGGRYSGPSEDSWYKVTALGFASMDDEEPCAETEFYLMEGGEPVMDWRKWDLSSLGKVVRVQFNMSGSEDMSGSYGLTVPAYFAYDDVAVRFEL